jgi:Na+-driven multidrug efflux pump
MNFGANNKDRVNKIYKYGVVTIIIISAIWLSSVLISPNGSINLFMNANSEVLSIAPSIMRAYCLVFIFLPFNVFSVYCFQSILKPLFAFIVSALRGLVISVPLLFILPKINSFSIWYAMLITEAIVFIMIVAYMLIIHIKEVKAKDKSLELSKQNL